MLNLLYDKQHEAHSIVLKRVSTNFIIVVLIALIQFKLKVYTVSSITFLKNVRKEYRTSRYV